MPDNVQEIGKLGFGFMRLPKKGLRIDIEQTKQMVDMFMNAGFSYFDTAFIYPGSEVALKKALVDRYPRDSYQIATKMNALLTAPTAKAVRRQFSTSLKRTGAGYFDYYLLHALHDAIYKLYDRYHLWDFVQEQKEKGLIKHVGFSFHGTPGLLDELLDKHPEVEFVQLQINYADWEKKTVRSRENYEVARKHGVPIIVMEPVKGGVLADPPEEVARMMKDYRPDRSCASWALRFAASLPGVLTVLSGMSNVSQMQDNLGFMSQFEPLNEDEQLIIQKAQHIMGKSSAIDCTACGYCFEGCPNNIPIPHIFAAANMQLANGQAEAAKRAFDDAVMQAGATASDCIACGKCEMACPQHLPIIEHLEECADLLEGKSAVY